MLQFNTVIFKQYQRVAVDGQSLKWFLNEAGVPQGSIFGGPTLPFLH